MHFLTFLCLLSLLSSFALSQSPTTSLLGPGGLSANVSPGFYSVGIEVVQGLPALDPLLEPLYFFQDADCPSCPTFPGHPFTYNARTLGWISAILHVPLNIRVIKLTVAFQVTDRSMSLPSRPPIHFYPPMRTNPRLPH